MKDDVVDVDALEKIVAEEKTKGNYFLNDQKMFWAMYYTISIFHNPTGMTLPPGNLNISPKISSLHNQLKNSSHYLLTKDFDYISHFPPIERLYSH